MRPVITWGLSALAAERSIAVRYPLAPRPISGAVITLAPSAAQSGHADLAALCRSGRRRRTARNSGTRTGTPPSITPLPGTFRLQDSLAENTHRRQA